MLYYHSCEKLHLCSKIQNIGMMLVDCTTQISNSAIISKSCKIGRFCKIEDNVVIGENTQIDDFTIIKSDTKIGSNTVIGTHCLIGCIPANREFTKTTNYTTIIGSNTRIDDFTQICSASLIDTATHIGDNSHIAHGVYIGHDCKIGNNIKISAHATIAGKVKIYDSAVIGAAAFIHQFCSIGAFVMVGASAKVSHDVPPYLLVDGNPAHIKRLNTVGLARHNFTEKQIQEIFDIYNLILDENSSIDTQAISEQIKYSNSHDFKAIIQFVKQSERGCCYFHPDFRTKCGKGRSLIYG